MANQKLTALSALTTPSLDDIVYIVDAPAGTPASRKATVEALRGGYVLQAVTTQFSPADATTYFFGFGAGASTTEGLDYIYFPRAGTITAISITFKVLGTTPSNQTSTVSLRYNAATDTTISSSVAINSTFFTATATGLSIAVATSNPFQIKWVTPTWTTNPTNVIVGAFVYVS